MSTGAEIISLTANPDTIASLDVKSLPYVRYYSQSVTDHSGNAVAGETGKLHDSEYNRMIPDNL